MIKTNKSSIAEFQTRLAVIEKRLTALENPATPPEGEA
jgi:hypothetical protein